MQLMQSQWDGSKVSGTGVQHLALADLGGLPDDGGVGSCAADAHLRHRQRCHNFALRHW